MDGDYPRPSSAAPKQERLNPGYGRLGQEQVHNRRFVEFWYPENALVSDLGKVSDAEPVDPVASPLQKGRVDIIP
jgi:hypothetical protein